MTTVGKFRHLMQSSTEAGHFSILAIDHRDNLLEELNRHAPTPLTDADFVAFKQAVIRLLAPEASAVLTDPVYGIGPGIADGALSGRLGLLSPLEVTDYSTHPSRRALNFIPGWSVAKIKRIGASGVKLLVYYHPESDTSLTVRDVVSRVVEQCTREDIPLFLEPIAFSPDERRALTSAELRAVVVDSARTFSALGVDILKLQFPLDVKEQPHSDDWRAALAEVDAACTVPWALLSAGVDYDTFYRQSELACAAGASGVIVGRAVWAEATKLQGAARDEFLRTVALRRMSELAALCASSARDWRTRVTSPDFGLRWYEHYGSDRG